MTLVMCKCISITMLQLLWDSLLVTDVGFGEMIIFIRWQWAQKIKPSRLASFQAKNMSFWLVRQKCSLKLG